MTSLDERIGRMVIIKKLTLVFCVTFIFGGCECLEPTTSTYSAPSIRVNLYLSRLRGQTHKYFSSRITVSGNYITNLEVIDAIGLPKGITLNKSRGILEGTPTQAGFFSVRIKFRDRVKGAGRFGKTGHYYEDYEIKIFDKLSDEK